MLQFFENLSVGGSIFALLPIQKHNLKRSEEGPVCLKADLLFPYRLSDLIGGMFSSYDLCVK